MKHPNIKKVRRLADTFLFLHEKYEKYKKGRRTAVNMRECRVNEDHKCGTVHCHAGWWAIGRMNLKESLSYSDGSSDMAKYLGFGNYVDELENWAQDNPKIWGNTEGVHMFSNANSFDAEWCNINLKKIGMHWHKVANRLEALNG